MLSSALLNTGITVCERMKKRDRKSCGKMSKEKMLKIQTLREQ